MAHTIHDIGVASQSVIGRQVVNRATPLSRDIHRGILDSRRGGLSIMHVRVGSCDTSIVGPNGGA